MFLASQGYLAWEVIHPLVALKQCCLVQWSCLQTSQSLRYSPSSGAHCGIGLRTALRWKAYLCSASSSATSCFPLFPSSLHYWGTSSINEIVHTYILPQPRCHCLAWWYRPVILTAWVEAGIWQAESQPEQCTETMSQNKSFILKKGLRGLERWLSS